ncbi:hypothetical protein SPONN_2576 [uncultured Candidatus Thioglobus sp.]|nr:hypothetical protein SPONN_2576 [uncultured Candidatus Thioglobus sp.]SMM98897.1 hypothetical protein SPONL_222 [uncultured Candidatus Thioglobus sp.]
MHLMQSLNLDKVINQHFPALNSNRSIKASVFISTLVLSQHEGSSCLDDTIHIKKDKALCLLNKAKSTNPTGDWYLA